MRDVHSSIKKHIEILFRSNNENTLCIVIDMQMIMGKKTKQKEKQKNNNCRLEKYSKECSRVFIIQSSFTVVIYKNFSLGLFICLNIQKTSSITLKYF